MITWQRRAFLALRIFHKRISFLIREPMFLMVSIFGNGLVLLGSLFVYHLEYGLNPKMNSILDAIWWAVATVTTVGYGDFSPVTTTGKIIGIVMMVVGTALFWSYTALVAGAFVSQEISEFELDIHNLQQTLDRVVDRTERQEGADSHRLATLVERLEKNLARLKEKQNSKPSKKT